MIRIACIIPDRGDRPAFMNNCLRMLAAQTWKPDYINIVDHSPKSDEYDITERYRIGYSEISPDHFDLILLIENDDWYAPNYIETMVKTWENLRKPALIGVANTSYYHIGTQLVYEMKHNKMAIAMSTAIIPGLNIQWCADNEPFTDVFLWKNIKNSANFCPETPINMGIKHGIGKTGGGMHSNEFRRYQHKDFDYSYLKQVMQNDPLSQDFYIETGESIKHLF